MGGRRGPAAGPAPSQPQGGPGPSQPQGGQGASQPHGMSNMTGHLGLRSSPLSPTSSKLTTQYLVLDHMNNHFRKIGKAKAAIDNKPPKSMQVSQKARDKKVREYVARTGVRPPSGLSRPHSQANYRAEDIYDEEQWGEPEDEDERYVYEIMRSTLKQNQFGSTHATYGESEARQPMDQAMMAPQTGSQWYDASQRMPVDRRPPSQARRPMSARSMASMGSRTVVQGTHKDLTYDGDVLDKRAHVFTDAGKPFTPRTLKSNRTSKLSEYKYYNSVPKKKETYKQESHQGRSQTPNYTQDELAETMDTPMTLSDSRPRPMPRNKSAMNRTGETTLSETQDTTLMFESLQTRDLEKFKSHDQMVPPLNISLDKDNMSWIKDQASRAQYRSGNSTQMSQIGEDGYLQTTNGLGETGMTTGGFSRTGTSTFATRNLSRQVNNEEEELKYLDFIKDVTSDVLTRGIFSNKVLMQVFENHIEKRKGELNEKKMRALINKVRRDLGIPKDESGVGDLNLTGVTSLDATSSSSITKEPYRPNARGVRAGKAGVATRSFASTMDSQDSYDFNSTAGDMFSTIRTEAGQDLSDTQALEQYEMTITKKDEEIVDDQSSVGEVEQPEIIQRQEKIPRRRPRVIKVGSEDLVETESTSSKTKDTRIVQVTSQEDEKPDKPSRKPRRRGSGQRPEEDDTALILDPLESTKEGSEQDEPLPTPQPKPSHRREVEIIEEEPLSTPPPKPSHKREVEREEEPLSTPQPKLSHKQEVEIEEEDEGSDNYEDDYEADYDEADDEGDGKTATYRTSDDDF